MSDSESFAEAMGRIKSVSDALTLPRQPSFTMPHIPSAREVLESVEQKNYASEFHRRLTEMIAEFERHLDPNHEVGVRLVSFGQTVVFHLESIGYYDPSLIRFLGKSQEGEPVELIQHVSQISILLMRLPALTPGEPRRIGFHQEPPGSAAPGENG